MSAIAALYMLGEDKFFTELLIGLSNNDYKIRCSTANLLALSIRKHHVRKALEAIENAMIKENSQAAFTTFKNVLESIKKETKRGR